MWALQLPPRTYSLGVGVGCGHLKFILCDFLLRVIFKLYKIISENSDLKINCIEGYHFLTWSLAQSLLRLHTRVTSSGRACTYFLLVFRMVCILFCSLGKRIDWGPASFILSGRSMVCMSCSCGWATGSKRVGETPLETSWVSSKCSSHAWDLGPSLSQLKGQDFHWMKGTLGFVPSTSSSFHTVFTHVIGAGSHSLLTAVNAWSQETSILVLYGRSLGGGAPGWQTWVLPLCTEGAYHLGEQYTEYEKGRKLSMGLSWTLNHLFHWLCHFSILDNT